MTDNRSRKPARRKRVAPTLVHAGKRTKAVIETGVDCLNRPVEYFRIIREEADLVKKE
jgi:hypothetical protein